MPVRKTSISQIGEIANILVIRLCKKPQHVLAFVTPGAYWEMCVRRRNHGQPARERLFAQKALIRIYLCAFRMIDCNQAQLVDKVGLLHRLAESETQSAI